jgi:hypothetical protein
MKIVIDTDMPSALHSSSSSMPLSVENESHEELENHLIEVIRKSQGKHPKKSVNDILFLE